MTTNEVKPGTRCECHGCATLQHHDPYSANAVRLVAVYGGSHAAMQANGQTCTVPFRSAPMCEACADYHEGGAK